MAGKREEKGSLYRSRAGWIFSFFFSFQTSKQTEPAVERLEDIEAFIGNVCCKSSPELKEKLMTLLVVAASLSLVRWRHLANI